MKHKYALAACTWFQNTFGASIILSWSIPSVNITGHTKRGTVVGVGFVVFAAGNIISPHFFDSKDAPRFKPATTGLLVCYSWLILAPLCLAGFLHYRNKSRDRKGYIVADREEILAGFADQTDFENKGFRYIF
ncbi:unnamed protein product [Kuraishia capsulata CBS 1993]|uniref:Major facilitator superfamily (MFS) profile domain-containing protein n=1 Tax=Kuraishia capsulata CBS 1993 TaxID=1382522 RepID=W6MW48_9ASCO|nr:uncharacterized protein KUCA_T00002859001 [Kuraishia capsulata CBS 1993]CDK26885.1 unnamed protein product [Kuraishia capsulata CBS 1993]